ncbi:MAG: 3'(2'),5'-bisphosphate nucleotidase CysQ [Candidatus Aureabacteria bacterium]|nr:3'(2'),5'-bisphosphate nucleotidase CysQ [Candidatus Auribacterota bacterium]
MKFPLTDSQFSDLKEIILLAGEEVRRIYESRDYKVELKEDDSPLTAADKASQDIILKGLGKLFPKTPIISEESKDIPYEKRKYFEYFWLVDPLDGTKEFISRNGEFTINVSLIHKNIPVIGLVYLPAKEMLYFAQKGKGAFKEEKGEEEKLSVYIEKRDKIIILRSRSHSMPEEEGIVSGLGTVEEIYAGSALKFCLVAEGIADIYIRTCGSMEWDTAAGQCIVESAGGGVYDFRGDSLRYNKSSLLNPAFYCFNQSEDLEKRLKRSLSEISFKV